MAESKPVLPGYREVLYWRLSESPSRLGLMQGLAVVLLLGSGWVLFRFASWLAPEAVLPVNFGGRAVLAIIAAVLVMILMHEGVHGMMMRLFGARPVFGIWWEIGVAYATAPGHPFTRNQFVAIAVAPLVVLSVGGVLMLPFAPPWLIPALLVFVAFNISGAAGDVWMTVLCLGYPAEAMVIDERDGIRVFLPV